MSTRSTIAILRADNTVSQIFCHWDGYLSHNGVLLYLNYQDTQKVEKLIALGSVSSLDKEVDIPVGSKHNYSNRVEGITTFYGRDRGEEDVGPVHFESLAEYKKEGDFQGYDYLFNESEATWYLYYDNTQEMEPLVTALEQDSECVNLLAEVKATQEKLMLTESVPLSDKNPTPSVLKV